MLARIFKSPWLPAAIGWGMVAFTIAMQAHHPENSESIARLCASIGLVGIIISAGWSLVALLQRRFTASVIVAAVLSWGFFLLVAAAVIGGAS